MAVHSHSLFCSLLQVCQREVSSLSLFFAAIEGPSSFENYTDPKTGKQGNGNIGVTVGKFRDNQLVSTPTAAVQSTMHICIASQLTLNTSGGPECLALALHTANQYMQGALIWLCHIKWL